MLKNILAALFLIFSIPDKAQLQWINMGTVFGDLPSNIAWYMEYFWPPRVH